MNKQPAYQLSYEELLHEIDKLKKRNKQLESTRPQPDSIIYQNIVDTLPLCVYWKDKNNNLLGFNEAYQKFVGLSRQDLLTKSCFDLFPNSGKSWKDDVEVIKTGRPKKHIVEEIKLSSGKVWLITDKVPYKNEEGEIIGVMGVSVDITDYKKIEEALFEAQAELSRSNKELQRLNIELDNFAYTASHDLRSPIAQVEGLLQLLTLTDTSEEDYARLFRMVGESVKRFRNLLNELTDVAKSKRQIIEGTGEENQLKELVEDVLLDVEERNDFNINLELQVPVIKFSRKGLRSILYNLLSNAMKYSSAGRTTDIKIRTLSKENAVVMEVEDNGIGMSLEKIENLFTPYKRFHPEVEGTGVGLFMIRRTLENAGGKIDVISQEGRGSTFRVWFPL